MSDHIGSVLVKNEAGVTLPTLIVGAALVSTAALSLSSMSIQAAKTQKMVSSRSDFDLEKNHISKLLATTQVCADSFGGLTFDSHRLTGITLGMNGGIPLVGSDGTIFYEKGKVIGGVAIQGLYLHTLQKVDHSTFTARYRLEGVMPQGPTRAHDVPVVLRATVDSVGTATVQGCFQDEPPPPLIYETEGSGWNCTQMNVEAPCGDADGCHIRILSSGGRPGGDNQWSFDYFVAIEDKNFSFNRAPAWTFSTSTGYRVQLGAGPANILIPIKNYLWIQNFEHRYCPGQNGRDGPPDPNPYLWYVTNHPWHKTRIVVYD